MSKRPNPESTDEDNPEWTAEDFARTVPFDQLPESLKSKLERPLRGPVEAPSKERISIRLSRDVVDRFRATGDGWQERVNSALKDWLKNNSPV